VGVHGASIRAFGRWLGAQSAVCLTVMNAPSPPLRRPCGLYGARQVSWLAAYRRRRLPRLMKKPSGEKSVDTPLTVAGAATDRQNAYRVPFSPSGADRGTVRGFMSQLREGLSNNAQDACLDLRGSTYPPKDPGSSPTP
jgi:hypothetical protein